MANQFGGIHAETATLTNVLANMAVTAPHTGQPFTEAMLLGIGGGLGAGYILWEFERLDFAIIVMGFRNRWNYSTDYLTHAAERIGAGVTVQETAGQKKAADQLKAALDSGKPVIVWTDKATLPYWQLPEALIGHAIRLVGVYGWDNGLVQVDDLAAKPFDVAEAVFAAARNQIPSNKNRIMTLTPPASIDLPAAIKAGIEDCIEHIGRDSESFSLPVYKKWAKLMTDPKNKKGWPVVFKNPTGLYDTLRSVYEDVIVDDTDGAGLRSVYADFLAEAAPVLDNAALKDAQQAYTHAATQWRTFAEAALPDTVAEFVETKQLLRERYMFIKSHETDKAASTAKKLNTLQANLRYNWPLAATATAALFENLSEHLTTIYEAETQALAILREAMLD